MEALLRYRLIDSASAGDLECALALLDDEERRRLEGFRDDRDGREFALAHALLRSTLTECGELSPRDWRFEAASGGKPRLRGGGSASPSFNLSHTRGLVACIVAPTGDVGIDVEYLNRSTDWRRIAERYFSGEELAQLERGPTDRERFYELWTLKEAFAKALGVGVLQVLSTVEFRIEQDGGIEARLPADVVGDDWRFKVCAPSPEHRCAIAVRRNPDRSLLSRS